MKEAERVESAFRRSGKIPARDITGEKLNPSKSNWPLPMEIGNAILKKYSRPNGICVEKRGVVSAVVRKGTWTISSKKPVGIEPHYGSSYSSLHQ